MIKAVFPGTFDPPTYGHLNIVSRGRRFFDSLDVIVALNSEKSPYLSPAKRCELLIEQLTLMEIGGVSVRTWDGLAADYCHEVGAKVLLRGVRSRSDFDYEFELSLLNRHLGIETVLLPAEPQFLVLSSSAIMELFRLGGDISCMVPPEVKIALESVL